MAGDMELIGVAHPSATVHQITNRLLRERKEVMANPFPTLSQPGNSINTAADGDAIAGPIRARRDGPREHQIA